MPPIALVGDQLRHYLAFLGEVTGLVVEYEGADAVVQLLGHGRTQDDNQLLLDIPMV